MRHNCTFRDIRIYPQVYKVLEGIPRYSRTRFYHQIDPFLLLGGDISGDKIKIYYIWG